MKGDLRSAPSRCREGSPAWLTRCLSGLGLLLCVSSPAGAAGRKLVSAHHPTRVAPDTPWTEAGGFSPPPSPPARSGGASLPPWEQHRRGANAEKSESVTETGAVGDSGSAPSRSSATAKTPQQESDVDHPVPHPVLHPETGKQKGAGYRPLFEKAGRDGADNGLTASQKAEKAACMRRHPAGKGFDNSQIPRVREYTVKPGDTLWDIAEEVVGSDDPQKVARYWPRLHRANRAVLGADPNLLLPGQVLRLPTARKEPA